MVKKLQGMKQAITRSKEPIGQKNDIIIKNKMVLQKSGETPLCTCINNTSSIPTYKVYSFWHGN
jgi:hypothetical protein